MPKPLHNKLVVSNVAQPLSASPVGAVAYTIKASTTNVNPVFLGSSTVTSSNGFQLDPGDVFEYQVASANGQPGFGLGVADFFVVGTASDTVSWLASP